MTLGELGVLLGVGVAFKIYYVTAWRQGRTNLLQSSLTRAIFFSALTTATAAINSNVLTFTSAAAASVGDSVSGAGIPPGTTVREKSSTTVTLSNVLTSAISSGTDVFFGDASSGALWLTSVAIAVSATVTVTRHRITAPGA